MSYFTIDTASWIFWAIVIVLIIFIIWFLFADCRDVERKVYSIPTVEVDYYDTSQNTNRLNFSENDTENNLENDVENQIRMNHVFLNENSEENEINNDSRTTNYLEVDRTYIFNKERKFKSIPEMLSCKIFEEYLGREVLVNVRPDILRNHETNTNLEYDIYDPINKIAIEYNGEQHYIFPSGYIKDEKDFKNQIFRDNLKKKLSEENGIFLIVIPFTIDTCKVNSKNEKGYTKIPNITIEKREQKLKEYLYPILDEFFNN